MSINLSRFWLALPHFVIFVVQNKCYKHYFFLYYFFIIIIINIWLCSIYFYIFVFYQLGSIMLIWVHPNNGNNMFLENRHGRFWI